MKKPQAGRAGASSSDDTAAQAHDFMELPSAHRRLFNSFIKSYKVVVEAVDKDLRDGDLLSLAEYEILALVDNAGGRIRFKDLANMTLLSQSRISRQVDALQAKGFLRREITDTDRRATYALLTPQGRVALEPTADAVVRALEVHFYNRIPKPSVESLVGLLEGLLEPGYQLQTAKILNEARKANGFPPFTRDKY